MAKKGKAGDGHRNGQFAISTQFKNSVMDLYVKGDTDTGRIMEVKTRGGKFTGVQKER
jgi:hypothetical protein